MPITEENVEENAELIESFDEEDKMMKEYFLLKCIVDVEKKSVHVFDADAMKRGHLIQLFRVILSQEFKESNSGTLTEEKLFQLCKDRFIGCDIMVPEKGKTINILIGFSGIELGMKQKAVPLHSRESLEIASRLLIKELQSGNIEWSKIVVQGAEKMLCIVITK